MTDWAPEVATIPPERFLLLELVRLCKAYRVEEAAWRAVVVTISYGNTPLADRLLAAKKASLENAESQAMAQFRRIETALIEGTDYQSPLREMLEYHRADFDPHRDPAC